MKFSAVKNVSPLNLGCFISCAVLYRRGLSQSTHRFYRSPSPPQPMTAPLHLTHHATRQNTTPTRTAQTASPRTVGRRLSQTVSTDHHVLQPRTVRAPDAAAPAAQSPSSSAPAPRPGGGEGSGVVADASVPDVSFFSRTRCLLLLLLSFFLRGFLQDVCVCV